MYSVQCTVYSQQCTVYSVQCILYSLQFTVYSVQCIDSIIVTFVGLMRCTLCPQPHQCSTLQSDFLNVDVHAWTSKTNLRYPLFCTTIPCTVIFHIILHYPELNYTALGWTTFKCNILYCIILDFAERYYTALYCSMLHFTALHKITLHWTALHSIRVVYSALLVSIAQTH